MDVEPISFFELFLKVESQNILSGPKTLDRACWAWASMPALYCAFRGSMTPGGSSVSAEGPLPIWKGPAKKKEALSVLSREGVQCRESVIRMAKGRAERPGRGWCSDPGISSSKKPPLPALQSRDKEKAAFPSLGAMAPGGSWSHHPSSGQPSPHCPVSCQTPHWLNPGRSQQTQERQPMGSAPCDWGQSWRGQEWIWGTSLGLTQGPVLKFNRPPFSEHWIHSRHTCRCGAYEHICGAYDMG